jgi:hypothetical protein
MFQAVTALSVLSLMESVHHRKGDEGGNDSHQRNDSPEHLDNILSDHGTTSFS